MIRKGAPVPDQQVVIRPGMDESIDPRHLPIGTPRLLQNVRVRQGARFEHRPGQAALTASGLPAAAAACLTTEYESTAVAGIEETPSGDPTGRALYALSDGDRQWQLLGRHGVLVPERRFGVGFDASASIDVNFKFPSCTYLNGTIYTCWTEAKNGVVTYVRASTPEGVLLRERTFGASAFGGSDASEARLLAVNSELLLVTNDGTGQLGVRRIHPLTLGLIGSGANIDTMAGASSDWDVAPLEGSNNWIIAYPDAATSLTIRVMSSLTSVTDAAFATTAEATLIGVAGQSGETICCAYADGSDIEARIVDASTLVGSEFSVYTISGNETLQNQVGVCRTTTNTFALVFGGTDSATSPSLVTGYIRQTRITSAGSFVAPNKIYHYQHASKPFLYGADGSKQVLVVAHNKHQFTGNWQLQASHYVLELAPTASTGAGCNLLSVAYEHLAAYGQETAFKSHLPEVADLGSGRRACLFMWHDPNSYAGIDIGVFRIARPSESTIWASRHAVQANRALYVSGGALLDVTEATSSADTHYLVENGFPYDPEIGLQVATGTTLTVGREYSYVGTYRWTDTQGRVHRSAPSAPQTITSTSGMRKTTVRFATLEGTGRSTTISSPAVGEIWRAWNGGPYYRLGLVEPVTPGSLSATYTDSVSESTAEGNPTLYTDSAILPNEPPSGCRLLASGNGRLFVVGWRASVVQVSKLLIPTAPAEFCDDDTFRVFLPEELTALAHIDGVPVAFSARNIYLVTGDGPNDQGVGSFDPPRALPVSVGADSPHVVETPAGLMYKGGGTIWLMPRGFGPPMPVGDQIQRTLAAYPYLRAAVRCVNDDDDLTHFLLANGDTTTAATLVAVWDNKLQAWSRDQLACDIGAAGSVGGVFHALLATWSAVTQVPARKLTGSVSDLNNSGAEVWPEMRIGFGDWRPYGPLGFGRLERVQIHGEVAGECDMNVVVVSDGVTGMNAAGHTILSTKHMTGLGQFYAENAVQFPPGGAYRVDIYSSTPTNMTSGLVIHGVAFSAGEPDGLRRMSNAERF